MNRKQAKLITLAIIFLISISTLFAQEKSAVKEKLEKIKGSAKKVIIETDKGTEEFIGEQAEYLLKKITQPEHKIKKIMKPGSHVFISEDGDSMKVSADIFKFHDKDDNLFIIGEDDDDSEGHIFIKKFSGDGDSNKVKVEVEDENGQKKVKVTTWVNGEEKTEVFEGDAADEKLSGMNKKHKIIFFGDDDKLIELDELDKHFNWSEDCDDADLFFIEEGDLKGLDTKIKIKVDEENGEMKVTVDETKDGKTETKVYTGDEAKKFLEEHKKGDKITIKIDSGDCDGKPIKMIKKIKHIGTDKDFEWNADCNQMSKKVEVRIENGVKKVKVTTMEDGKEKIEEFEGAEAEKYLKKMETEKDKAKKIKKEVRVEKK